jgi:hypothetical protein
MNISRQHTVAIHICLISFIFFLLVIEIKKENMLGLVSILLNPERAYRNMQKSYKLKDAVLEYRKMDEFQHISLKRRMMHQKQLTIIVTCSAIL